MKKFFQFLIAILIISCSNKADFPNKKWGVWNARGQWEQEESDYWTIDYAASWKNNPPRGANGEAYKYIDFGAYEYEWDDGEWPIYLKNRYNNLYQEGLKKYPNFPDIYVDRYLNDGESNTMQD